MPRRAEPLEVDSGMERSSLARRRQAFRWWFFASDSDGFRFARGGRADSMDEARREVSVAWRLAVGEQEERGRRPTHLLGPRGELIPVDEVGATSRPALPPG